MQKEGGFCVSVGGSSIKGEGGDCVMDHPASTSLHSHQPLGGAEFEVFISFRGPDVRTGFADHLYTNLVEAGIRAFRDDEELRVGEKIGPDLLKAIRNSKIAIPIFSRGYASSKWCLLELVEMVECSKTAGGQLVLPVFYDAEVDHVKNQTGSYGDAFKEHIKHFSEETLRQWRRALKEVGALKGWELKSATNGHEGRLVNMICTQVWRELKKNYALVDSESLVGMDHHENEMIKLLGVGSNDVRIVGIHGMGGIGKSTIAKVVYNKLLNRFDRCCFLADVREMSKQKGLVDLQNQLISTILRRKHLGVTTADEGSIAIRETFCTKKVLIVLDDVDQREQLAAFAQNRSWFGIGSRIIVTTRNKDILNMPQVNETYEPKEMDSNLALQLFSKHAFRTNHPPIEFAELSDSVTTSAAGLPLALVIIGSFLCGKKKDVWEYTLKKLKHIPHEKVQEKLRLSYDALDDEQKQIFLDIACFFCGFYKRVASHMWEICGFFPENSIEVLSFMSLVEVGENDELRMHDQLRDLGREIVRKESILRPEERSRLWSPGEALDVLRAQQGTKKVEALVIDGRETYTEYLRDVDFARFPNLRYLRVAYAKLKGDFNHLLLKLNWLRWSGAPKHFTLLNFHLRNLTILELLYGEFADDWGGWKQLQVAKKLKVLYLCHSLIITRSPDLGAYVNLDSLILEGCQSLVSIHPSLWELKGLRFLVLSKTGITELPKSIGMLKKLQELYAYDCPNLREVSSELGSLKCLRVLNLSGSMICRLPTSMHLLTQLQQFCLLDNTEFESLPELPPSLVHVWATCRFMQKCSHLSRLGKLETLELSNCHELLGIPEMDGLSQLNRMKLSFCSKLRHIQSLPSSLLSLCLRECPGLVEIKGLKNLGRLKDLLLRDCGKLCHLDGLEKLRSLQNLAIVTCASIEGLADMSDLTQLEIIYIVDCNKVTVMRGLNKLKALTMVEVVGFTGTLSLSILQQVHQLKKLESFSCCTATTDRIGHVEILKMLENVEGPCTVTGRLSMIYPDLKSMAHYPDLKSMAHYLVKLKFGRNTPTHHFRCPVANPYLLCSKVVAYVFREVAPDHGVDRELQYALAEPPLESFLLQYEGKQFGNSFTDYFSFDHETDSLIRNNRENAAFSLAIKERKDLGLPVLSGNESGFRPQLEKKIIFWPNTASNLSLNGL